MNAFLFYHQVGGVCEKEMLIFCMDFQKKKKITDFTGGPWLSTGRLVPLGTFASV